MPNASDAAKLRKGETVMRLTVRRVKSEFLKWANAALAMATVAAYKHQLDKIPPRILKKKVSSVRPIDLTAWANTWHEGQAFVRLLNWARDEAKLIRVNPLTRCRLASRGQRKRILARAALQRIMRTGKPASRHFMLALRETLARPQEIRAAAFEHLQSEDIDMPILEALQAGRALIVQHEFKDRRRRHDTTRPRVLLISRRLGRLIVRIARQRGTWAGPIFLNNRGRAWSKNAVRCLFRRIRRRLRLAADTNGENIVAYTFRHSLATYAASKGVHGRTLADLLGHVETRTTDRYVHLQVGHLRDAMSRFTSDRSRVRAAATPSL